MARVVPPVTRGPYLFVAGEGGTRRAIVRMSAARMVALGPRGRWHGANPGDHGRAAAVSQDPLLRSGAS
jgi:hypothetical protein